MAQKAKQTKSAGETRVTRITASDDSKKASSSKKKPVTKKPVQKAASSNNDRSKHAPKKQSSSKNIFQAIGGYFKGAWQELRQVRWPNRRTTWALTFAVIIFTIFFLVLITLLDTAFKFLFEQIIS